MYCCPFVTDLCGVHTAMIQRLCKPAKNIDDYDLKEAGASDKYFGNLDFNEVSNVDSVFKPCQEMPSFYP